MSERLQISEPGAGAGLPADVRLVAHTVELDPAQPCDLVAVAGAGGFLFEREGHGVAGRGEALRIPLSEGLRGDLSHVVEALSAIELEGEDGGGRPGGPIAFGALPFDACAASSMVVPAILVGRSADGRQWMTTIGPRDPFRSRETPTPAEVLSGEGGIGVRDTGMLPDGFSLRSPRPHPEWEATVADAIDAISSGALRKVVVAREVVVEANRPIVVPDVLERLRSLYPACIVFSVEGFIGASPELLVERRGDAVRSHPLAGTFPRSGDPHADELAAAGLVASMKDQAEHRFVIDQIEAVLSARCSTLEVPRMPEVMLLRNVLHLGTEIRGVLSEPAPDVLELVAALHPTPAVAGTPTVEALEWLAANEALERGRYAGPVGWIDAHGDGMFAIGIRSAEVEGTTARLFAGVGVVEGSESRRELIETQLKLQAILAAVVRP